MSWTVLSPLINQSKTKVCVLSKLWLGFSTSLNLLYFFVCLFFESFELSFIWGKMTAAQETAPQIALRNCSKKAGRKVSMYVILVKGKYMQSSTYFSRSFLPVTRDSYYYEHFSAFLGMRRYKNWSPSTLTCAQPNLACSPSLTASYENRLTSG